MRMRAYRSIVYFLVRTITLDLVHYAILDSPGVRIFEGFQLLDKLVGGLDGPGADGYELMLDIGIIPGGRVDQKVLTSITYLEGK
jgi:hypothetical protein